MDQRTPPPGPHRFEKGKPRPERAGRVKGSTNKAPRLLKEAIMMAAELEGSDQRGKDKLIGFLRRVAREDLRAFVGLLGRVIPLQVETKGNVSVEVTYRSVDEVKRELASRGISIETVQRLMGPQTIDYEDVVDEDES